VRTDVGELEDDVDALGADPLAFGFEHEIDGDEGIFEDESFLHFHCGGVRRGMLTHGVEKGAYSPFVRACRGRSPISFDWPRPQTCRA
jgi:hypothetical protein